MNRDRVVIVLLALLLAVSLGFNWKLWTRTRGAPPAAGVASTVAGRGSATGTAGSKSAYEVVRNPEMAGRLGRIVIPFAGEGKLEGTRTAFFKPGSSDLVQAVYGRVALELPPGGYDLEICGRKMAGVPVESGKDTRLYSGVLRLHGSSSTRFVIHTPGSDETVHVAYGNAELGLPAGEYEIEIGGQREPMTIEHGKVTDF